MAKLEATYNDGTSLLFEVDEVDLDQIFGSELWTSDEPKQMLIFKAPGGFVGISIPNLKAILVTA